jgi:predicted amidohydrolase
VIIGYPRTDGDKRFNSVAVLDGGRLVTSRDKVDLPNYGEFDEKARVSRRRDARDRWRSAACASAFRCARTSGAISASARR